MKSYILKSAQLADGTETDIVIEDGVITALEAGAKLDAEVIDANGLMALGGFVDLHTHLL